jgi:hypothetical protein
VRERLASAVEREANESIEGVLRQVSTNLRVDRMLRDGDVSAQELDCLLVRDGVGRQREALKYLTRAHRVPYARRSNARGIVVGFEPLALPTADKRQACI